PPAVAGWSRGGKSHGPRGSRAAARGRAGARRAPRTPAPPAPGRSWPLVVRLEGPNGERAARHERDALRGRRGGGERGEVRHLALERRAANREGVAHRLGARRRVDDQRHLAAVQRVASRRKPQAASRRAIGTIPAKSLSGTERKAVPPRGSTVPAAICALANAAPKLASIPITSPVDFISGPSTVSTPGNLMNGKTASLTLTCAGAISRVRPCAASERPTMQRAATLASGTPIALLTKGT